MIKLLCPNCMKSVAVPDDAAGAETPCPECGAAFAVPSRYHPVVAPPPAPPVLPPESVPMSTVPSDRPAPPPGLIPSAYSAANNQLEPPLPPPPPPPPVPHGYTHSRGVTISPVVMAWVPAVFLTLILVLTFFDWVGSYVGGHPVYAQNAWRSLTGSVARNFQIEELIKQQAAWPADVLNKVRSDWEVMLPYLLALVLATAAAWAERMVATLDRTRLPPPLRWVGTVWPYRIPVTAGLATVALLLVLIQVGSGFGLERAMRAAVNDRLVPDRTANKENAATLAAIDFKAEQELARFNLERTTWLHLAILLNVLVVVAMVVRSVMERRGNRPPPRLVLQY